MDEFDRKMLEVRARLTAPRQRLFDDIAKRSEDHADAELKWILELHDAADTLVARGTDAPWPYFGMFWIRLHAVILKPYEEKKSYDALKAPPSPSPHTLGAHAKALYDACQALSDFFTQDEHVLIDFYRHRSAHPRTHGYTLQPTGKGGAQVKETRELKHRDITITIDDADRIRAEALQAYTSEEEIALAFAKKSKTLIDAVVEVRLEMERP